MSAGSPALSTPRAAMIIAGKDLRLELRSRDVLSSAGLFAIAVLVTASFTLPMNGAAREGAATGVLWISLLFAVLLGVGRSMAREQEDRAIEGLLLSPAPRESVFLGKLGANLAMVFAIEAFVVPMFVVLVGLSPTRPGASPGVLLAAVLLATTGLVTVSTLLSAIAVGSRLGESVLPLIVMPIVIPLMIAAVEVSRRGLGTAPGTAPASSGSVDAVQWLVLLLGFDALVLLVALATFAFVVEE